MANKKQVKLIKEGVKEWNKWRREHLEEQVDLSGANLIGADLVKANLGGANLSGVNLRGANLSGAVLEGANLVKASLYEANLVKANLWGANLLGADLVKANLSEAFLWDANLMIADLSGAKLHNASMERANLVETNLKKTDLTNCRIYGISAWNVKLDKDTKQSGFVITKCEEPTITVDDIEVAQFIHLILRNEKIRNVIDAITTKVVLILGRFTPKRKAILDAIKEKLRKHGYIPVLFDFEKPASKDIHETVITLANLAKFVIADITSPKSIPQELTSIVKDNPSLPVKPIIKKGSEPWRMFGHIKRYPWVLDVHEYKDLEDLISSLEKEVIIPAEVKVEEVRKE